MRRQLAQSQAHPQAPPAINEELRPSKSKLVRASPRAPAVVILPIGRAKTLRRRGVRREHKARAGSPAFFISAPALDLRIWHRRRL
jgi:hypothetical protein